MILGLGRPRVGGASGRQSSADHASRPSQRVRRPRSVRGRCRGGRRCSRRWPGVGVDGASRSLRGCACGRPEPQRSTVQRLGHGSRRDDPRRLGRRRGSSRRRHRCRHVRDPLVRRPAEAWPIVRDAHSLYVETFGELGLVGLTLIVAALLVPLVAAVRGRHSRFVAPACGAYVAWVAASGLDWHWEMVGLTVTALLLGGVGLVAAERGPTRAARGHARIVAVVGVTATAERARGVEPRRQPGSLRRPRGPRATRTGVTASDRALAERSRCSPGRTSRTSCAATPLRAWAIAKQRFARIEKPPRRIRATGLCGSGWPRSHAAPKGAPRTTGCID